MVSLDTFALQFINLHLDHRKETTRLDEIESLLRQEAFSITDDGQPNLPHVWLGDFNSLTRSDYSDKEWRNISETRSLNSWEPPKSDLTSFMVLPRASPHGSTVATTTGVKMSKSKKSHKKGKNWDSTVSNSIRTGLGLVDTFQQRQRQGGPALPTPPSTCRFGTRIDYTSTLIKSTFLQMDGNYKTTRFGIWPK